MPLPAAAELPERLAELRAIDAVARPLAAGVRRTLGAGPVKRVLSGAPVGHALHPALTDAVIGAWTSATLLDLIGGRDSATAARRLVGVGLVAALPTALSGLSDWADAAEGDAGARRLGAVHAAANVTALTCYALSFAARCGGRPGAPWGLAGAGALSAGGFLGGHLTYVRGVGVGPRA